MRTDSPGAEPLSAARPIGTVSPALPALSAARPARAVSVPPTFLTLCATVVLHADPNRFGLLYRLLWRMAHEPGLRHDPLDPDRLQAEQMAKAVRRDIHKMRAFVRFRTVADGGMAPAQTPSQGAAAPGRPEPSARPLEGEGEDAQREAWGSLHVAWFEPLNHIVEANAPFFKRRFTQMRWAILTPRRCVAWDGRTLTFGPGARKEDAPPADAGEGLWLTYYAHIFNPARLKLKMMQKEMPRRYWPNLPEAKLIGELSAQAMARSGGMIDQAATVPARRIRSVVPVVVAGHTGAASRPTLQHLSDLQDAANRCRACPIGAGATQAVVGEGPANAALMVVGEQPGDHEDLRGRPFVGPAGQLFDRAVRELGWSRDRLYVTNAVKHFKYELRGTRRIHKTPHQQEVDACLHWLESELELVAPQAVLALGATAARAILGRPVAVMRERGQWHEGPQGRPVLVTLHPSALLRADPGHAAENFRRWVEDLSLATELAAG
ncbi:UdgX family uracil-DNA binding protein [Xylophilus ampelinus]|uniref:UdgX family uracil-DNA binding protein n=1 Tax=Xylophilus ampelinus TaxID=54067 RepID=UPI003899B066